jgi:RNA polymerase sigma-70 factor (ECF subfamily)
MSGQPNAALRALDDVALAKRCAAHDADAIRHVVTANNQRLFRAAWSVLKDRAEAEEAVQSGYLNAFAHIGEFAGRSALSTWLTRIVVNEALGRLRAARRRSSQLARQGVSVLDDYRETLMRGSQAEAPDAEVARRQLRLMIEHAIAGLSDSFRAVFVLRDIEGLSVEETAEALEIPAATVKTRLLRARRKLQETLEPDVRTALTGAFPFAGADCEAMTDRVLAALA